MTTTSSSGLQNWLLLAFAAAVATPAIYFRFSVAHLDPAVTVIVYGLAILGAAFVISWTAEAAEHDISQALAIAFLALIAVLPEYSVSFYFAWTAPEIHEHRNLVVANMTGANRLLIGVGWPVIFGLFWLRTRRDVLTVPRPQAIDLGFLAAATLYSFSIPLRGHLSVLDAVILVALFGAYVYVASRRPSVEPELMGPARVIGALPARKRRPLLVCLFLYSALAIFAAAEPFAEGMIASSRQFGINEFLLVQWIAPLASEAPEFTIAAFMVLRGRAVAAMTTMIASKINQWTLLVGTLPLAYSVSGGSLAPLDFDLRQSQEIFLTAAQSAFAVMVFLSLSISRWEALALFLLFATQLFFPDQAFRIAYGVGYLVLTAFLLVWHRHEVRPFVRAVVDVLRETRYGVPVETGPAPH